MMISELGSCKVIVYKLTCICCVKFSHAQHFQIQICNIFYFNCSVDTFVIETLAVGSLKRVRIGHDNKGVAAGWFLDKVRRKLCFLTTFLYCLLALTI